MTKETLRQRKEWRRCSGELPEGGWLVINGVGKVMRETDDGLREPYNGDASGLIDAGARIRIARIAAGLTQEDLAKRVGLTQGTLWEWESGRRNPTRESLDKVFDVLTPHDGPASSDASADGAADADTHSDVATSRPMPRTKANLRRLRDATETSQASLAIAAGLDINNPASVKDVRHWEDPKNRRWAPEPVWLMLEDTLTDQRATARETAKAIVEQLCTITATRTSTRRTASRAATECTTPWLAWSATSLRTPGTWSSSVTLTSGCECHRRRLASRAMLGDAASSSLIPRWRASLACTCPHNDARRICGHSG